MSGRLINVRRDNPDTFYRYKMEPLQTKIEGKGNGIKTVVVNLSSVAQSLARPGSYLIKYFGFELGAQTNIDPADDRWIINGAHDASKLQDYLDGFINKFVLCKKCKNPETDVQIKDGHITLDCKACGQRTDVDLRLKLSSFILKNQPKKGKKDKAERKAARKAKQANGNKENGASGEDNSDQASPNGDNINKELEYASDDDAMTRKIKTEAQGLREDRDVEVDDDDWAVDMSEEAVKARQRSLPSDFQAKLVLNADEDDEEGEGGNTVYDQLGGWIQEQAKEKGGVDNVDDIDVYVKAKELGIETKHRTVLVLVQTLFDENVTAQIGKRASMLKRLINDSERHEKALLGGTERLLGSLGKDHYGKIVKILQLYYHHELASEDVIKKWGTKASKKYVDLPTSKKIRRAAEPFLKWLEEAEEEEDTDEDDE
ncbi:Eukaryotic translation initiation factor 5 [Coniochaeta hoffmannii]|uniref:Eukaryotic translation initiation factor 5 n=1 Tax=Coniochaeta hoffmannii TaxID=91930 RepID=A0AA38SE77_9PEZI|nr:Eukaryotic translation initiation factor 5 [Coniochaeta hoffmannii]